MIKTFPLLAVPLLVAACTCPIPQTICEPQSGLCTCERPQAGLTPTPAPEDGLRGSQSVPERPHGENPGDPAPDTEPDRQTDPEGHRDWKDRRTKAT